MPLVMMCGTPLSGKSYRAKQLYDYLSKSDDSGNQRQQCVLITDEEKLLSLGPNRIYMNAGEEKELRAWLKSEVQRNLALPETIVILDAANYIKGCRYELYCLSKLFRTTHVVIECGEAPLDAIKPKLVECTDCDDDNDNRRNYSRKIFDELVQRFEKPNANNRWDSPLFRVEYHEPDLPYETIADAVLKQAALKPNQSTQSMPITTDNFLNELDNQTQEVIRQIQNALRSNQLHGIKVAHSDVPVNLVRKIPIAELNKLRRQFINYTRINPFPEKERIVPAFVQFINKIAQ